MYILYLNKKKKYWLKNGIHHRKFDKPCVEYLNGNKFWAKDGLRHRDNDQPAVEYANGDVEYWSYGIRYEIIEYENGTKEWHRHHTKSLHRDNDQPAVKYANGDVEYWKFGIRHRENGPAVIYGNNKYWFIDGEFLQCIV
jgi:hypothetical protein